MNNDLLWRLDPKYIAACAKCGRDGLKRNMVAIYIKNGAYSNLKIMCHFCPDCMTQFADELGVAIP